MEDYNAKIRDTIRTNQTMYMSSDNPLISSTNFNLKSLSNFNNTSIFNNNILTTSSLTDNINKKFLTTSNSILTGQNLTNSNTFRKKKLTIATNHNDPFIKMNDTRLSLRDTIGLDYIIEKEKGYDTMNNINIFGRKKLNNLSSSNFDEMNLFAK